MNQLAYEFVRLRRTACVRASAGLVKRAKTFRHRPRTNTPEERRREKKKRNPDIATEIYENHLIRRVLRVCNMYMCTFFYSSFTPSGFVKLNPSEAAAVFPGGGNTPFPPSTEIPIERCSHHDVRVQRVERRRQICCVFVRRGAATMAGGRGKYER